MAEKQLPREEVARIEIGHTKMTPAMGWALVIFFAAVTAAVPVLQHVREIADYAAGLRGSPLPQSYDIFMSATKAIKVLTSPAPSARRVFDSGRFMLGEIKRYEEDLEQQSVFASFVLPRTQEILTRTGLGNEQAYCGRDGWLFYRPGIDYVMGPAFLDPKQLAKRAAAGTEWKAAPQPDPRLAILQLARQLSERGITLIVMPAPDKATIHPENFWPGYKDTRRPLQNPSFDALKAELESNGVLVLDVAQALVDARISTGRPQYLESDTHWTPEAMGLAARMLRDFIAERVQLPAPAAPPALERETAEVRNLGDIAAMLKLPESQTLYAKQSVTLNQVLANKRLWQSSSSADVLVLGDSFSNIYSLEAMGWGESAGFIEQLSFELGRPVDRLVRNDAGSWATRQMLSRELAKGRDRLAGKKVVVWEFAARELAVGDWKLIDMKLGEPLPSRFVLPPPGAAMAASGTVESLSAAPRPGTVAYKDHIIAVHLIDVEGEGGAAGEAIVYMWSMRDNKWTRAARFRPGTELKLTLRPWADVAEKYDGINRAELEDEALQLEEPCWGEEKP